MKSIESSAVTQSDDGSFLVIFDLQVNKLTAIKKAVYKFAADCSAILRTKEPQQVEVRLSFPDSTDLAVKKAIVGAFCNEVIDQDLREQISQETEASRNLILAQAFSKTSLLQQD
jgi:His-Xaa-Ser system protein HxsD